jgi:hypothetical protein
MHIRQALHPYDGFGSKIGHVASHYAASARGAAPPIRPRSRGPLQSKPRFLRGCRRLCRPARMCFVNSKYCVFQNLLDFSRQQHTSEKGGRAMLHMILLMLLAGMVRCAAIIAVFETTAKRHVRKLRNA